MQKIKEEKLDGELLIEQLNELIQKNSNLINNSIYKNDDCRKLVFQFLISEIQNYLLIIILSKSLQKKSWYSENGLKTDNINDDYLKIISSSFTNSNKDKFFISSFVQFEYFFRLMAIEYNCENRNIGTTVKNLLSSLQIDIKVYDLWKIFSHIRNCMHNGGFHNNPNENIVYKNIDYVFIKGNAITYSSVKNIIYFIEEIIDYLIIPIIEKSQNKDLIQHTYTKLTFEYVE